MTDLVQAWIRELQLTRIKSGAYDITTAMHFATGLLMKLIEIPAIWDSLEGHHEPINFTEEVDGLLRCPEMQMVLRYMRIIMHVSDNEHWSEHFSGVEQITEIHYRPLNKCVVVEMDHYQSEWTVDIEMEIPEDPRTTSIATTIRMWSREASESGMRSGGEHSVITWDHEIIPTSN